ncbi:MAG: UDP-N-acetylmuramoyl-tripeptide--D-alanyl-D-alanine ligase [Clostridiaceae bacterium]|nr:UDP-N-acetylmuramoyl-tripeptide--D-alanyl-D-alanine ligase [Clostridiaceae bacterium]
MEPLSLGEVVSSVHGEIVVRGNAEKFTEINTDTRKINPGSLFIALKGENFNGNNFVVSASSKGAVICIVDEINFNKDDLNDTTTVILVNNTRKALLDLAKYYRSKLKVKVIGITGSTGKTSTKDLTCAVLSEKYKVFKTQGNFNNEIGLPLMIFKLDKSYDIAVLEMGMSNFKEIHNMAEAARPDMAMITNIGISHIENLKTRQGILNAKLEITDFFNSDNTLIVNSDNDMLYNVEKSLKNNNIKVIKTGISTGDFRAEEIVLSENSISFKVYADEVLKGQFNVPVPGKHNVLNALLAIACGYLMNMTFDEMARGIQTIQVTSMRLDIIKRGEITIINDTYNASPDSVKAAVDVLKNMQGRRKVAILGTMRELGSEAYNAHMDCGKYAAENGVDLLIAIGEFSEAFKKGFNSNSNINGNFKEFNNFEETIEYLRTYLKEEDCVLVKASRAMKFEAIVDKLKEITL